MKFIQTSPFEKHLLDSLKNQPASAYLLCIKDTFTCYDYAKKMALLLHEPIHTYCGDDAKVGAMQAVLDSRSLFSDKEVLFIHQKYLKKPFLDLLSDYLDHPSPHLHLIFSCQEKATHPFFKKMEKKAVVLDLLLEKPWDKEARLAAWVIKVVKRANKVISIQVATQLLQYVGADHGTLALEIDKLITFIGDGREIFISDIMKVCSYESADTLWQAGNFLLTGDLTKALKATMHLLDKGTVAAHYLTALKRLFQICLQVIALKETGYSLEEIQKAFPNINERLLQKHMTQAQSYGKEALKKALIELYEYDLLLKENALHHKGLIQTLCMDIVKK